MAAAMQALSPRLITLDGLRGLAVMGILLMNIAGFALPDAAYFNPLAYGPGDPADLLLWVGEFVLVDGKMRALFSLLFGASLLLVLDRARAAGEDSERAHFRRMGWLLFFGLVHFYLIWHGDILVLYAVIGCAAWFFSEASTRNLLRWGIALIALQAVIHGAAFAGTLAAGQGSAAWQAVQEDFGIPSASAIARDLALHRGSYAGLVWHRVSESGLMPFTQIFLFGAETLGFMLLGMAGLRSGFLTGQWDLARYRRCLAIGYGIGLPLSLLLAGACWWSGFDAWMMFAAALPLGVPARPFLLLGHVALGLLWLTGGTSSLRHRVAAAGRAAFTNYLGASLLMTGLFYGYGAGLFGKVDRFGLLAIVVAIWALMLLWSPFWLDRCRYGPLEWLWRSLARGQIQSMRK
ncbi:hypothetical protein ACFB49_44320 [Sphingomonas sp. DBB INV C78]